MGKSLNQLILFVLVLFVVSCSTGTPVATQYKQERGGGASVSTGEELTNGEDATGSEEESTDEEATDEEGEEEEEVVAEPTPEELALMQREAGKQVYDAMCLGCHGDPAVTTLNARDPAVIAMQNTLQFHTDIAATFPNAQVAEQIVAYLVEPL